MKRGSSVPSHLRTAGRMQISACVAWAFILVLSCIPTSAATAGCGLDPVCAIGQSFSSGASEEFVDKLRPLVADVMERQAPALIAELQRAVDHNILTADEAAQQLIALSQTVLNAVINDAELRGEKLAAFVQAQISILEIHFISDIDSLLERHWNMLNCTIAGVNADLDQQQAILWSEANQLVDRLRLPCFFCGPAPDEQCRRSLRVTGDATPQQLGPATTFRLWSCYRLALINDDQPPDNIALAYSEIEAKAFGLVCAWRKASATGVEIVTEKWNEAGAAARAWRRSSIGR